MRRESKISDRQSAYVAFRNCKNYGQVSLSMPTSTDQYQPNQTQLFTPSQNYRKQLEERGHQALKDKKLGVVIFAGGLGNRSQIEPTKQFELLSEGKSLFEKAIEQVLGDAKTYIETLYIIANKFNAERIVDEIDLIRLSFGNMQVFIAEQDEAPVLDGYGIQTVYQNPKNKLTYPNGIGSFGNANLTFQEGDDLTLLQHAKVTKLDYLYCYGISNESEPGIDFSMIGFLDEKKGQVSTAFKYILPEEANAHVPRVAIFCEQERPYEWLVMEYQHLCEMVPQKKPVMMCPAWMNNFVIDVQEILKLKARKSKLNQYQFAVRMLKDGRGSRVRCNIAEKSISHTVMPVKSKCVGIRAKSNQKYHPMIFKKNFTAPKEEEGDMKVEGSMKRSSKSRLKRR